MKTDQKIRYLCAAAVALFSLAGCSNGDNQQWSSSPSSQPEASFVEDSSSNDTDPESSQEEQPSASLTPEEAETLAKAAIPKDFQEEYALSLNDDNHSWNGRSYYRFLLDTETYTLDTSLLVDKETRQVFTYYPDGATYAPLDDPFFTSFSMEMGPDWTGSFTNPDGVVLALEKIDSTSFEFTLEGNGVGLKSQIARILSDPSTAQSTSLEKSQLFFQWEENDIRITVDGESISGLGEDSVFSADNGK